MGFKSLGANDSTANNKIYLSLRTGKICESSKEEKEGFVPAFTVNQSGQRTDFFAKEYDSVIAYLS